MANLDRMALVTRSATAALYYDFSETLAFYISGEFTLSSPGSGFSAGFSSGFGGPGVIVYNGTFLVSAADAARFCGQAKPIPWATGGYDVFGLARGNYYLGPSNLPGSAGRGLPTDPLVPAPA